MTAAVGAAAAGGYFTYAYVRRRWDEEFPASSGTPRAAAATPTEEKTTRTETPATADNVVTCKEAEMGAAVAPAEGIATGGKGAATPSGTPAAPLEPATEPRADATTAVDAGVDEAELASQLDASLRNIQDTGNADTPRERKLLKRLQSIPSYENLSAPCRFVIAQWCHTSGAGVGSAPGTEKDVSRVGMVAVGDGRLRGDGCRVGARDRCGDTPGDPRVGVALGGAQAGRRLSHARRRADVARLRRRLAAGGQVGQAAGRQRQAGAAGVGRPHRPLRRGGTAGRRRRARRAGRAAHCGTERSHHGRLRRPILAVVEDRRGAAPPREGVSAAARGGCRGGASGGRAARLHARPRLGGVHGHLRPVVAVVIVAAGAVAAGRHHRQVDRTETARGRQPHTHRRAGALHQSGRGAHPDQRFRHRERGAPLRLRRRAGSGEQGADATHGHVQAGARCRPPDDVARHRDHHPVLRQRPSQGAHTGHFGAGSGV
eukprot:ctg_178.g140